MLADAVLLSSWLENAHQNLLSWEKAGSAKLKHLWDSVLKPGEVSDAPTRVQRSSRGRVGGELPPRAAPELGKT